MFELLLVRNLAHQLNLWLRKHKLNNVEWSSIEEKDLRIQDSNM